VKGFEPLPMTDGKPSGARHATPKVNNDGPEKSGLSFLVVLALLPQLSSRIVSLTPADLAYLLSKYFSTVRIIDRK